MIISGFLGVPRLYILRFFLLLIYIFENQNTKKGQLPKFVRFVGKSQVDVAIWLILLTFEVQN